MASITYEDEKMTISNIDGCIDCPFEKENRCGADNSVIVTHQNGFPTKCPLLNNDTIEVKRV